VEIISVKKKEEVVESTKTNEIAEELK